MKCPYCEKEMELGYIQCRDGIAWTPKRRRIAAFSYFGKDSISLQNSSYFDTAYAFKCGVCCKVIIDCSGDFNPTK